MRFFSLLTAALVAVALVSLVLYRDQVFELAGRDSQIEENADESSQPLPSTTEEPERRVSVVALRSTAQSVDSAVILRGQTEAARQVDVRAETSGRVISEPLRKGASVEEGQILCEIDAGTRRASVTEAEANLGAAEIAYNAAAQLTEGGYRSETALAQALAALESAQAGVERARTELGRIEIRAPFSGLLESDTAELGSLLQPGAPCATIIDLSTVKIVGYVPETQVSRVEVGAMAGAELVSGERVFGTVSFLSRSADQTTRTFRVEIEVPNPDLAISDGQTASIGIASDGRSAHLLPQSALTLSDDGYLGVRTVEVGDITGFTEVTLIRDAVDGVWVAGLPDEVSVITIGQEFVTDGVLLNVTYEAPE